MPPGRPSSCQIVAFGYSAELLPKVCEVFLDAEEADVLAHNQLHIAKQAHILIRGLAHVGIVALVDEATGYQEVRDRLALREILDRFLRNRPEAVSPRRRRRPRLAFCRDVNFFASEDAAAEWLHTHPDGWLLPVAQAHSLARDLAWQLADGAGSTCC